MPDFDRIRVLLKYDGTIHWEPGGIFRTTCDIDISFFPFDAQVSVFPSSLDRCVISRPTPACLICCEATLL